MATTITTYFSDDEPTLTSRISSVRATTDKKKVEVSVVRDPNGEIDEFYRTTLYAYNGRVELTGLGKLIEENFRAKGRIYDMIEVKFDETGVNFMVLYCEYALDENFDYSECFYSVSGTSIVHEGSVVQLSHWPNGSTTYKVQVVGIGPDGKTAMVERNFTRTQTSLWVSFSVQQILDFALNRTEYETGDAIWKVVYFAISHGEIQKIFYLAEDPEYLTFCFRNIFNAPEYVDVVGTVTKKTKADRDLALCDGRALQYNRTISRTYEVQTAALTEDQAKELEQMITSHQVELCAGSESYPILITDHTCEVDNDDETLITMKFTFRFANSRPTLIDNEMGTLLASNSHIFSNEFTAEFA